MAAVTSKSAMTPWRSGRIARIVAGVRPIIFRASSPTACTRPLNSSIATTDGSKTTMPRPRTNTKVFAVPRSIANSRPARIQLTPKTPTEPTLAGARPKGSAGPGVGPALRSHSAGACEVDVSHRDGAACRRVGIPRPHDIQRAVGIEGAAHQVAVRVLALFVLCGHRVEPDEARLRSWYVAAWSAK